LSGAHALLRILATYQPAGGPGGKVFPPTYPTSPGLDHRRLYGMRQDTESLNAELVEAVEEGTR